jgi:hypothetical protein
MVLDDLFTDIDVNANPQIEKKIRTEGCTHYPAWFMRFWFLGFGS